MTLTAREMKFGQQIKFATGSVVWRVADATDSFVHLTGSVKDIFILRSDPRLFMLVRKTHDANR